MAQFFSQKYEVITILQEIFFYYIFFPKTLSNHNITRDNSKSSIQNNFQ